VQTKAAEATVVKDDADEDLARALPILKKAKQIVDALDKAAVGEIKGYANPPPPVVMTMEAVVTIFGQKDLKWESIKKEIMDPGKFIAKVQSLDVETVPESIWKKVRDKWFKMPGFKADLVTGVSVAAGKLCEWALALSEYQIVNKNIIPKKAKADEMDKILKENMAIL
jgi:dynein heavy chain